MSTAAYFSAAVPQPYRVLGLTLRPLSLGRYRTLKRFNCGFVREDGDGGVDVSDLIIGVLICSQRVDTFLQWANSPTFAKDVSKWSKRLQPHIWIAKLGQFCCVPLAKWWRRKFAFDAREKLILFRNYIEEGSQIPKFWDEGDGGRPSGAHWSQTVEVALRSDQGWTREEIDEEPLSKALSDYCKFLESKGAIRMMTEDEITQSNAQLNLSINGKEATEEDLQRVASAMAASGMPVIPL